MDHAVWYRILLCKCQVLLYINDKTVSSGGILPLSCFSSECLVDVGFLHSCQLVRWPAQKVIWVCLQCFCVFWVENSSDLSSITVATRNASFLRLPTPADSNEWTRAIKSKHQWSGRWLFHLIIGYCVKDSLHCHIWKWMPMLLCWYTFRCFKICMTIQKWVFSQSMYPTFNQFFFLGLSDIVSGIWVCLGLSFIVNLHVYGSI